MAGRIEQRDHDGIRVLTLWADPVRGLDAGLRAALDDVLNALEGTLAPPRGLVLIGAGGAFPSGHSEHDPDLDLVRPVHDAVAPDPDPFKHMAPPAPAESATQTPAALGTLCLRLERLPFPVVAALGGDVCGAGVELALAAHARIAADDATLALSDVTLGLPPGAGGSQRLPRLVGAHAALDILLTPRVLSAADAATLGLVQTCAPAELETAALSQAHRLAVAGRWVQSGRAEAGFADPTGYWQALQAARVRTTRAHPAAEAQRRIVQCVEAAQMMPLAQGLGMERAHFLECAGAPASRALRHLARIEALAKTDLAAQRPARACFTIGVVGAGGIGPALVADLLRAGYGVVLVDETRRALSTGLAAVEAALDAALATGAITPDARAACQRRLGSSVMLSDLAGVDMALAAPRSSDPASLTDLFGQLGQTLRPGAILASADPNVPLADLAAASGRPADMLGLLLMPPLSATDLIELVPLTSTAPDVLGVGYALARKLGRVALRSAAVEGGIARRLLRAYRDAADFTLEDGANPAEIDRAMRAYGFPIGPYEGLDREGLEVSAARRRAQAPFRDPALRYVEIGDRLCAKGRFGRRVGKGYYAYPDPDGPAQEDMEVVALIDELRAEKGIRSRAFTDAEIQTRCVTAMMNAGAQLLVDRVAQGTADIDLAAIHGLGFPRFAGGPMWMADELGIEALKARLDDYSTEAAHFWSPAALILKLADEGGRLYDHRIERQRDPVPVPVPDPAPEQTPEADPAGVSAQEQAQDDDHQPEGRHEE